MAGEAAVNVRVEAVTRELADLIQDGHLLSCDGDGPCTGPDCADYKARAVLAYLHGAGVLAWGQGHTPLPRPPEGGKQAYAVRVGAEFWHPVERTPEDIEHDVTRYQWLPGVLATAAGYDQEGIADQVRTFVDDLAPEQVAKLRPMLRTLLATLDEL